MPKWTPPLPDHVSVAFLLFDRFSNLCLANCLEPLRAANTLCGRAVFDWHVYSPDGTAVTSSSDLPILPHAGIAAMGKVDVLIVLASYAHMEHDTPANRRLLGTAARNAKHVIGHDTAPWLMASAGLLNERMATIHWDLTEPFAEAFLSTTVLRDRSVRDGPRQTSAGAMAAYDLTLDLVRDTCGSAIALDINALFISDRAPRDPSVPPDDPHLAAALSEMRKTLDQPLSLTELAARVGLRPKTLERRCQGALGATPGRIYRHMRLSAAFQMVRTTRLPISEIALRCGYDTPAALTRAFRARFDTTPRDLRNRPQNAVFSRN